MQKSALAKKRGVAIAVIAGLAIAVTLLISLRISSREPEEKPESPRHSLEFSDSQDKALPIIETARAFRATDDPSQDGWDTEAFNLRAKKQLTRFGKLLSSPTAIDDASVADLITDKFSCDPLLPVKLTAVYEDSVFKVERGAPVSSPPVPMTGAARLSRALQEVAAAVLGVDDPRFEFKVFEVLPQPAEEEILTRQFVTIAGASVEQNSTWLIRWKPGSGAEPPKIRSIELEQFEQTTKQPESPLFSDVTASVLGGNECYGDQFLRGMNHWYERIQLQDTRYYALFGNPGLAVGDVNGDGLDDLYVCQESGLPNRLFLQNPDGSAREQAAAWGIDWLEDSRGALLVDLDNDGDQDLAVAILGGLAVAENDGKGRFRLRDVLPTGDDTMSLSAVDYNRDGRLDLYVCLYFSTRVLENLDRVPLPGAATDFVVHDGNDGGANSLWRNEITPGAEWRFAEATEETGLNANNHRYSLACTWEDFDNDGDQDLYVANDFGRDNFYRNDSADSGPVRFVDISESARIEDSAFGMSVTCGDYDRDGLMDAYVSNMWSAAGNRVTFQPKFKPKVTEQIRERYQRLARGNTLLKNLGADAFEDRSGPTGVEMGRWSWGSHFVDLNNDGWEDLVVTNGFITTEDTGDL